MENQQEAQHFLDYWKIIRNRKEIILLSFLIVVAAGTAITLMMPKTYMASTKISVRRESPDVGVFDGYERSSGQRYDPFFLRTQFEILQSRHILHEVIRQLGLQEHFGRAYHPEGEPLSLSETYSLLKRGMRVHQYRDTNLIEIQILRDRPEETAREDAAAIANKIVEVFRDKRMEVSRTETMRGLRALRAAFEAQDRRVADAESALDSIRRELGISTIGGIERGRVSPLDKSELAQLEMKRINSRTRRIDAQARLEQLEQLEGRELMYAAAHIVGDPDLSKVRDRLVEHESHLSQLRESYGDRHPDVQRKQAAVRDLETRIDDILNGIKVALQTELRIAQTDYDSIEAELLQAREADIIDESERFLPFINAEREVSRQRQIRDALEMRLVQEEIEVDLPRTPVEIIDAAEVPRVTDWEKPNILVNVLLSIFLGLGMGVGLAFFVEYLDTSIKSIEDVERYIGAPVLGIIPRKVRPLSEEGLESPHAEAYRVLRTNLQFSRKFTHGRTLSVTSGGAGEGKSLTLFNLAYVCAGLGDKVLVVDSDLRRPTQHKLFGISNRSGLSDILLGKQDVDAVIKKTEHSNLDFLPSGRMIATAHGLLDSTRMRDLLRQLKERYRYVFFDAPPILGVSDAAVLATETDGVLMVVQHSSYPKAVSMRARVTVENIGGNLVGVALNNINMSREYYYPYYAVSTEAMRDPDEIRKDGIRKGVKKA